MLVCGSASVGGLALAGAFQGPIGPQAWSEGERVPPAPAITAEQGEGFCWRTGGALALAAVNRNDPTLLHEQVAGELRRAIAQGEARPWRPATDEPFNGMDPGGIIWTRTLLRSLAEEGRAVLVSSHLMGELQDMVSHVVVLGRGKVIADAPVVDVLAAVARSRRVLRTANVERAARVLRDAGATVTATGHARCHRAGARTDRRCAHPPPGRLHRALSGERASLQDAYLHLTRGHVDYQGAPPAGPTGAAR